MQDVRWPIRITHFTFGALDIDGVTYERDVIIDRGEIHQRKKKLSKKFRETFGHTPLSLEENIPGNVHAWSSVPGHMAGCQ